MTQDLCQGSNHDALSYMTFMPNALRRSYPSLCNGCVAALLARTQNKDISKSKTNLCRQQQRPKMNEHCGSREGKAHSGEKEEERRREQMMTRRRRANGSL